MSDLTSNPTIVNSSPYSEYVTRLNQTMEEVKGIGSMLVVGINDDDDDDDEEKDEEEDADDEQAGKKQKKEEKEELTSDQVDTLRHIIITKDRSKFLKSASKFASCGQDQDGFAMFNTHSGNNVISGIIKEVQKAMCKKTLPERFDAMFGLFWALNEYDNWMSDNEEWGEDGLLDKSIRYFGSTWKKLLLHSDNELGIDSFFTRRGILSLLEKFKNSIENCEAIKVSFDYL